ncbi:MAG TPA: hypothetical protein VG345_10045 [Bryobacteraceae bacterium]|nr:hypothetical protein [Bryobacteraceae bacterium]
MTIGIGVLATAVGKCDSLALASDTMGSIGDTHSTPSISKTFIFPDERLYIVCADQIEKASERGGMIRIQLQRHPQRSHGSIQHALHLAVDDYRRQRCMYEILSNYGLKSENWLGPLDSELRKAVIDDCLGLDMNCEMIIGTFTDEGQAILYYIPNIAVEYQQDGTPTLRMVRVQAFPGFYTIGTGAASAHFWLCYRGHRLTYSPKRAAYYAFEAKLMADKSPFVNEKIEMAIATTDGHVHVKDSAPESGSWSLAEFRHMYRKYGPQSTEPLESIEIHQILNFPKSIRNSRRRLNKAGTLVNRHIDIRIVSLPSQ